MNDKTNLIIPKIPNRPSLHKSCFIAPGAKVIGQVTLNEFSSIWYNSVLRGDINHITIGTHTNIQDNCMIHLENDLGCHIGHYVTVGHNAILHGCTINDFALIGMGAIILNGATIGEGAVIGAGALVKENTKVEPYSLYAGIPAKKLKIYDKTIAIKNKKWAEKYVKLATIHATQLKEDPTIIIAP